MIPIYVLVSVVLVSMVSLVGALTLAIKEKFLKKVLIFFVAFSTGALIGDSFIHLLPEAVEKNGFSTSISLSIFLGILVFFILEKILRWRHCHEIDCGDHSGRLGTMNLVGDAVHNFLDGVLIAVSYLVSIPLGIATTVAVVLHEIPQELGDFGVLIHSGFTKKKAILFNFLSASAAIAGSFIALVLGQRMQSFSELMVPFAAGGFIYIAMSDLIPELHKESEWQKSLQQLLFIIFGVAVMFSLIYLE